MAPVSYILCALTSMICFALLLRAYAQNKAKLLLWSSLCFFFLAVQNVVLVIDLVITGPAVSLVLYRTLAGFVGPAILLVALLWESNDGT